MSKEVKKILFMKGWLTTYEELFMPGENKRSNNLVIDAGVAWHNSGYRDVRTALPHERACFLNKRVRMGGKESLSESERCRGFAWFGLTHGTLSKGNKVYLCMPTTQAMV